MKRIKDYFKAWDAARIIRIVLAAALFIAYFYNRESLFLFVGIILSIQAVFNISCPGGSCSTGTDKNSKPVINVKKYEPNKE
jgi:hypothetical protein